MIAPGMASFIIGMFVFAVGSDASTQWAPAVDPYPEDRGAELAMVMLVAAGAPQDRLSRLMGAAVRHQFAAGLPGDACVERSLRPGEPIALMVGGHGVSRDLTVPDPWPENLNPVTLDCWDSDGHHLLRPEICGNWAYQLPLDVALPPEAGQWVGVPGNFMPYGSLPAGWLGESAPLFAGLLGASLPFAGGAAFLLAAEEAISAATIIPSRNEIMQSIASSALPAFIPTEAAFSLAGPLPLNSPEESLGSPSSASSSNNTTPVAVAEPWSTPLMALACAAVAILKWRKTR